MAEIIRMPKMSDTMTEGVIVEWHKKVGDKVKEGEILAEVETDKATMELESYYKGILLHIGVEKGDAVPVDSIIAIIGKEGEDVSEILEQEKSSKKEDKEKKEPGQDGKKSEKSKVETPQAQEKDTGKKAVEKEETASVDEDTEQRIKASPLARKLANEKGVNLQEVKGSGDFGRIIKRDIENFTPSGKAYAPVTFGAEEGYEDVNISQMRKTIARRLGESKFTAPHFYLTMEIDMGRALETRKKIIDFTETKISVNDMIIKAAAVALTRHPKVNASWLGDKIRYYKHVHIGVAIAVDEGLVVPVVKHADKKSFTQLSAEVKDFAGKANNKKLQAEDFEGNTFTISNLGMYGIDEFTAIINPPDACILAVGASKEVVALENGQVIAKQVMKVTLSCDHRVVDGVTGAKFLQTFRQMLEEPVMLLA